jgi:hypothetical protein
MSDLNLPPRRSLPLEVRARMRERVTSPQEPARRNRVSGRLLAAAAVAALAAGVVVVTQSVGSESARPPSTASASGHDLNRCWNAILTEGKAHLFPDLAEWHQVKRDQTRSSVITSVLAKGKPIFCVTTEITVTVSDPSAEPEYAAGTRTGLLLATGEWIAGVADPSWQRVGLVSGEDLGSVVDPRQRLFTLTHPYQEGLKVMDARDDMSLRARDAVQLPPSPPPAVDLVDQPGDTSVSAKMFLATCLGSSDGAPTQHLWHAGVRVGDLDSGHNQLVLARSDDRIGVCTYGTSPGQDRYEFAERGTVEPGVPRQVLPTVRLDTYSGHEWVILGVAPAQAISMRVTLAGGDSLTAKVANATFALILPSGSADERGELFPDMMPRSAVALGPERVVVYDGPVEVLN